MKVLRRSQLFVPGNDERKIRKSLELGADSVILDLEDAVPADEKSRARALLSELLPKMDWHESEVCVRINKVGSEYSREDIEFLGTQEKIRSVVLPKADVITGDLRSRVGKTIIPLIETAKGFLRLEELVRTEGVEAIGYGPADFALSVGGRTESYSQNMLVKTKIAIVAAAYGVEPIDGVFFDLANLEGFRKEALNSKGLGFVGKQVIHPSQIQVANEVYSPGNDEISEALKIMQEYDTNVMKKSGAFRMEDKLIDAVHYRHAKSILERAQLINSRQRK